jgi:hypothetical protein
MTSEIAVKIAIFVLTAVFSAGGAWFAVKQMRKDLNGIGGKVGRVQTESDRRFMILSIALLAMCEEKDRERIADKVLEAIRK